MTGASLAPVVVLGPTASGKSDVAMAAATAVTGVEIIAVDSMQVYRGMDIGTAKPSMADRSRVRHHLLDIADPAEDFTVAQFRDEYVAAVADLAQRGVRPLLVAGTGLYLNVAIDRLDLPGQWPEIRARLEAEADAVGVEALHRRLAVIDAAAAERMAPTNGRRIVRALEVCEGSGRPFSSFGPGVGAHPPTDAAQIGLRWDRDALRARIATRVHSMVDAGLVAEVAGLLERPGGLSRTARQGLGCKEIIDHLEGRATLEQAIATIVTRTRQFAVRQLRWFRRDPRVRWIEIHSDPVTEAAPAVVEALTG